MKTTTKGVELIRKYEGFRAETYICPGGVLTIGYGHTGKDVRPGMMITEQDALNLLHKDIFKRETQVDRVLKGAFTPNMYSAIISFVYNLGIGNFRESTLLRKININPNDPTIRAEFMRWNKVGGKVLAGLTKRREEEANLYFTK